MSAKNITNFILDLQQAIAAAPENAKIWGALNTNIKKLQEAEVNGSQDEVLTILKEIQSIVQRVMRESETSSATSPNTVPDEAFSPFTDKAALKGSSEDVKNWIGAEYYKRIETAEYFKFNTLKCINNMSYAPPSDMDIFAAMTREQLDIIKTFNKPMLIMTPIGCSMRDLTAALASQKGAMEDHNPPANWWNTEGRQSADFDHDIRGDIVYGATKFDKDDHDGKTKRQLLDDPFNWAKGWQVLVVEGSDETPRKYEKAEDILTEDIKNKLIGLTPEDDLMLQAEGLRMGKPFESGYDHKWLTGAYLPKLGKVPSSRWRSDDSQILFRCYPPNVRGPDIGSRRAVRIL